MMSTLQNAFTWVGKKVEAGVKFIDNHKEGFYSALGAAGVMTILAGKAIDRSYENGYSEGWTDRTEDLLDKAYTHKD